MPAGTSVTFTAPTLGAVLSQRRGPARRPGGELREPGNPAAADRHRQRVPGIPRRGDHAGTGTVYDTVVRPPGTRCAPTSLPGRRRGGALPRSGPPVRRAAGILHARHSGRRQRRRRAGRVQQAEDGFLVVPAAVLAGARRLAHLSAAPRQLPLRGDADVPQVHHRIRARPSERADRVPVLAVALPGAHRHRHRVSRHHARGIRAAVPGRRAAALRPRPSSAAGSGGVGAAAAALPVPEALRGTIGLPAVPRRDLPELLRVLRAVAVGLRGVPQRRRRRRRRVPAVRAVLPGRSVAAVPRGAAGAGPGRDCWCSSGSGASCGTRAASATRSRSCATSATCCSCTPAARSTPTSSASSPRSRCCATTSAWTSPTRTTRPPPARSTPTARTCWRSGSGPTAAKWAWAVRQLIERVEQHAQRRHRLRAAPAGVRQAAGRQSRSAVAAGRLRPRLGHRHLARAARRTRCGSPRCWRRSTPPTSASASCSSCSPPTRTWTATTRSRCRNDNEALDSPLGLPDDEPAHTRCGGCAATCSRRTCAEEEAEDWPWRRIEAALHTEFGFAPERRPGAGPAFLPRRAGAVRLPGQPGGDALREQPRRRRARRRRCGTPRRTDRSTTTPPRSSCPHACRSPTGR